MDKKGLRLVLELKDILDIVNSSVGIIGTIVGIIGGISLHEAKKIKISAKAKDNSTAQAAETMYNYYGTDKKEITEMTQAELCKLVASLIPINTDDENCVANKLARGEFVPKDLDTALEELPRIYWGKDFPKTNKKGNIFFKSVD